MNENDSERIAELTVSAISSATDNVIKSILDSVEAAEQKSREMREQAERYIDDIKRTNVTLADNLSTHIRSCQAAIDSFEEHHSKILNVDPPDVTWRGSNGQSEVPSVARLRALHTAVDENK